MTETNGDLLKLIKWYLNQCNEDWEKKYGIKIDTIDNPGWLFIIDLKDTQLEFQEFEKMNIDFSEDNWFHCWVRDKQFQAGGCPCNLVDIMKVFICWADKNFLQNSNNDDLLHCLENWYESQCDGDWEHDFGVKIDSLANDGGTVQINIHETELQNIDFQKIEIVRSESDYIYCEVKNDIFVCKCGSYNMPEVQQIFRNWADSIVYE